MKERKNDVAKREMELIMNELRNLVKMRIKFLDKDHNLIVNCDNPNNPYVDFKKVIPDVMETLGNGFNAVYSSIGRIDDKTMVASFYSQKGNPLLNENYYFPMVWLKALAEKGVEFELEFRDHGSMSGKVTNSAINGIQYEAELDPINFPFSKKVFISQKMTGLTEEQIRKNRNEISGIIYANKDKYISKEERVLGVSDIYIIDNLNFDDTFGLKPLDYIALDIKYLAKADIVIVYGTHEEIESSGGCNVEIYLANTYNIPVEYVWKDDNK